MRFLRILFICFTILVCFHYNTLAQGSSYFDKSGKPTTVENAYYTRKLISGDTYQSTYTNGSLYFEGRIIKIDKTGDINNTYTGICKWYYKNGKNKVTKTFDEKGIENGTSIYYHETGKIWKEIVYFNGKIKDNTFVEYDENGIANRIFEEDFTNNLNDWDVYESDKSKAIIAGNILEIKSNTAQGTSRFISVPTEGSDIIIEGLIDVSTLSPGSKAGIIFGFKDWQNYNFFLISQSTFYVGTIFEGLSAIKAEDMYTGAVLKTGFNNLKILNIGDKSVFSINGEVQFTTDRYRLYGPKIGFIVSGKNTIKIDKLITKEIDINQNGNQSADKNDQNVKSTGSGIIISKDGYLVTNFHVIEEAKGTVMVEITRDGLTKNYKASIIKSDKENDLVILKIEDTDFKPYTKIQYAFKESGAADVGSTVYTIGFPLALSGMGKEAKFTDGKVSSKTGYNNAINSYQTSVPVQPGNSGGPLFDEKGKLIGVINAKIKDGDNVSYAIKLNYIKNLVELLPESIEFPNDVSTSTLTIQEQVKILSNYVVLIKVK